MLQLVLATMAIMMATVAINDDTDVDTALVVVTNEDDVSALDTPASIVSVGSYCLGELHGC